MSHILGSRLTFDIHVTCRAMSRLRASTVHHRSVLQRESGNIDSPACHLFDVTRKAYDLDLFSHHTYYLSCLCFGAFPLVHLFSNSRFCPESNSCPQRFAGIKTSSWEFSLRHTMISMPRYAMLRHVIMSYHALHYAFMSVFWITLRVVQTNPWFASGLVPASLTRAETGHGNDNSDF